MALLSDYTIDHQGLNWPDLLASWAWLVPSEFTVWIMNRFGDLFLVFSDGSVHVLDVGAGSVTRLADGREQLAARIDEDDKANDWLMIPLVDELTMAGLVLGPGECYSYITLPILGGDYSVANTRVVPIGTHYKAFGPIHEKLKDLPDGTAVQFAVGPEPGGRRRTSDEADEARGGTRKRRTRCRRVGPPARNRTHRLAAYRRCSTDQWRELRG